MVVREKGTLVFKRIFLALGCIVLSGITWTQTAMPATVDCTTNSATWTYIPSYDAVMAKLTWVPPSANSLDFDVAGPVTGSAPPAPEPLFPSSTAPTHVVATGESIDSAKGNYPYWLGKDGRTLYNYLDSKLNRSVDNGATWENIHTFSRTVMGMRDLDNGELLVSLCQWAGSPGQLWLSDGYPALGSGASWRKVLDAGAGGVGPSSWFHGLWGMSEYGNIVVVSEYGNMNPPNDSARFAYLSLDYGETWKRIFDVGLGYRSHLHGVAYDPWWKAIWLTSGDTGDARAIRVSFNMGDTWTIVQQGVNQSVGILPMEHVVLFGSDGSPNAIFRIDRAGGKCDLSFEVGYQINTEPTLTHIGRLPYWRGPGYPALLPFSVDSFGSGVLYATFDGFQFFEVWKDSEAYIRKGLMTAIGPTNDGYIIGSLADDRQAPASTYSKIMLTASLDWEPTVTPLLPTYYWSAVATTAHYQLQVYDSGSSIASPKVDRWYSASEAGCGGGKGICLFNPGAELMEGPSGWRVRAANSAGNSDWSDWREFTVKRGKPSDFEPISLSDLSITKTDVPDCVSVGTNLTYTLQISNAGPAKETGVVLEDTLPPKVTFISAAASQGSCTRSRRKMTCKLGEVAAGESAEVQIVVQPTRVGTITNTATVVGSRTDPNPDNNSAIVTTTVKRLPTLTILVTEPQATEAGRTKGQFTIYRKGGDKSVPLVVNYIVSGTATNGVDYAALSGTRTIPADRSKAVINVKPVNDKLYEGNETVTVTLAQNPAYRVGTPYSATLSLIDDDLPTVRITYSRDITEGSTVNGKITLKRSGNTSEPLTVKYIMSSTATNGVDYSALPGTATFAPGHSTVAIRVIPKDDSIKEGPEEAVLTLAAESGYKIGVPDRASFMIFDND